MEAGTHEIDSEARWICEHKLILQNDRTKVSRLRQAMATRIERVTTRGQASFAGTGLGRGHFNARPSPG